MTFGVEASVDASADRCGQHCNVHRFLQRGRQLPGCWTAYHNHNRAEPANAGIAVSTSGNITITTPGQSGTSTLTVTPSNGFGGSVKPHLRPSSGAAASNNPTCSVPASVSISGTAAQTATVTVSTTAATSASAKRPAALFIGLGGGVALAGVLLIALPRRRTLWLSMLCLVALGVALLPMGCGGGGSGGGTLPRRVPGYARRRLHLHHHRRQWLDHRQHHADRGRPISAASPSTLSGRFLACRTDPLLSPARKDKTLNIKKSLRSLVFHRDLV